MLDVINKFPRLGQVIRSVTMPKDSLLMTAMLGLILIYIYAAFAFLFVSDTYFDIGVNSGLLNKQGESICMSLMHCFLSTINYGLRMGGGMGEFLPTTTHVEWNSQAVYIRLIFDVTFFLIVITILLNVVFGIIIDTFAQLREIANHTEEDIKDKCFICGMDRYILERDTHEGFVYHITNDHYEWNYIYFIVYLMTKSHTELNGTESEINQMCETDTIAWFPNH